MMVIGSEGSASGSEGRTIVARATPPGRSALAIVRLSGPATREVLEAVVGPGPAAGLQARRPRLLVVFDRLGRGIDRALITLFPAPASYTGEDLAEISLHGAPAVVEEVVRVCLEAGASPAEPGEFTLKALEAGKIDLAQAEAVADLVEAVSVEQAHVATRQLGGEVSRALRPLAEEVLGLVVDVEASLDFAEEESALADPGQAAAERCRDLAERLAMVARRSESACRIREGARVVLVGPPNAGKSSLFNRLAGFERVLVCSEPGTTRDLIEEVIVLEGLPVVLVDAAGIGASDSLAERAGMERALGAARAAALVLRVFDPSASDQAGEPPPAPEGVAEILVGTHADRPWLSPAPESALAVSSLTGEGIEALRREVARRLQAPGVASPESVALATERHRRLAMEAHGHLLAAAEVLESAAVTEVAAAELRAALGAFEEILGAVGPEDLLGRIFSRFCIGK